MGAIIPYTLITFGGAAHAVVEAVAIKALDPLCI